MSPIIPQNRLEDAIGLADEKDELRSLFDNLGRECEVCGRKPAKIEYMKYVVDVLLIQGECECGATPSMRGYFENGSFELYDSYCGVCGDELNIWRQGEGGLPYETIESIESRSTIIKTEQMTVSGYWLANEVEKLVSHHVSYIPERTIEVCTECHGKIHKKEGFRPDLEPDISREQWRQQRQEEKYGI